ncbi:MAG: metal ABC transporter permease [Pseudomonadota bacterium]
MALLAALIGVLSVLMGIGGSVQWDTPTGPMIVLASALLFMVAMGAGLLQRQTRVVR